MTIINFTPNKDSLKPLHSQEETDFYADFITKQNEDFVKRWAPERLSGDEFIDYDLEQEETQMSSRGLFGIKGPKRITNQKEINGKNGTYIYQGLFDEFRKTENLFAAFCCVVFVLLQNCIYKGAASHGCILPF